MVSKGDKIEVRVRDRWLPATVESVEEWSLVARYLDGKTAMLTEREIDPQLSPRTWRRRPRTAPMADPTDETLTDDRLRHLARHWPTEMRAVAAELLQLREALRAADELAEALANERRVFDETPRTPSTSTAPIVRAIRRRERAEAAYRAARGER